MKRDAKVFCQVQVFLEMRSVAQSLRGFCLRFLPRVRGSGQGRILVGIGFFIAPLFFSGCDTSVQVVRESDRYQYSLYGVLNVAADTQFIRVEPIGDKTQLGAPREIEAEVYLENLSTETEVELRDSFATVRSNASSHAPQVHVFWTTHPIQTGTRYQLRVIERGETVTSARTITPPRRPEISYDGQIVLDPCFPPSEKEGNTIHVYTRGVDRIAAVHSIYPFQGGIRVNYSDSVESAPGRDGFHVPMYFRDELTDLNFRLGFGSGEVCVSLDHFQPRTVKVMVAAGGDDWPAWREVPFGQTVSPGEYSNVKRGHGFVGGIYSDTISVPVKSLSGSN